MRVLIAEDSGVIRAIIVRTFRTMGITKVTEAPNGAVAWKAFQNRKFDLVVTDWHMPKMDGLELTERIREVDCEVPIIMITIVDTREKIVEAIQAGVSDYLCKPFDRALLESKIDRHLPVA